MHADLKDVFKGWFEVAATPLDIAANAFKQYTQGHIQLFVDRAQTSLHKQTETINTKHPGLIRAVIHNLSELGDKIEQAVDTTVNYAGLDGVPGYTTSSSAALQKKHHQSKKTTQGGGKRRRRRKTKKRALKKKHRRRRRTHRRSRKKRRQRGGDPDPGGPGHRTSGEIYFITKNDQRFTLRATAADDTSNINKLEILTKNTKTKVFLERILAKIGAPRGVSVYDINLEIKNTNARTGRPQHHFWFLPRPDALQAALYFHRVQYGPGQMRDRLLHGPRLHPTPPVLYDDPADVRQHHYLRRHGLLHGVDSGAVHDEGQPLPREMEPTLYDQLNEPSEMNLLSSTCNNPIRVVLLLPDLHTRVAVEGAEKAAAKGRQDDDPTAIN